MSKLPGPPRGANGVYDLEGELLDIRPLPGDPPVIVVDINDWIDYKYKYKLRVIQAFPRPGYPRPLFLVEDQSPEPEPDQGLPDYLTEA